MRDKSRRSRRSTARRNALSSSFLDLAPVLKKAVAAKPSLSSSRSKKCKVQKTAVVALAPHQLSTICTIHLLER